MKTILQLFMGKSCYKNFEVNEPGVFYLLFYVQSRKIPKKTVVGAARKQSRKELSECSRWLPD